EKPQGPFLLSINSGQVTTDSRYVVLHLSAGDDTTRMSISNDPDFANVGQQPYQTTVPWTLTQNQGVKTVYVKFFTQYGVSSNVISVNIYYNANVVVGEFIRVAKEITALLKQMSELLIPAAKPLLPNPEPAPFVPEIGKTTSLFTENTLPAPICRLGISDRLSGPTTALVKYANYVLFLTLFLLVVLLLRL